MGVVLPTKDAATQARWDRIIGLAAASDSIDVGNPAVQGLLGLEVAEGLITESEVGALTTRTGSRAEVLFGAGAVVGHEDVARALRG